ncbi:pyrroline-5-carboxylate reductase [Fusarium austroafricanum]|uniref:Pyrroline-5-carboxylate reductase n=1 Tax=Fusarium austroafricanum TaxID=2364996 RepID=A0A8H4NP27_9HYPO|nr:pyrroline-5-carboxylate reductase [Fusarium austroafricanum]
MPGPGKTLTILGTGNITKPIVKNLLPAIQDGTTKLPFARIVACVRSEASEKKLFEQFAEYTDILAVSRGDNVGAVRQGDVIVLGVDPADIADVLAEDGMPDALSGKPLISVAAGWTKEKLEAAIYESETTPDNYRGRAWVIRTLPNIACMVSEGLIAIEKSPSQPAVPKEYLDLTRDLFNTIGRTVEVPPRLMNATTAVGGSTPAFWAVICDAFIDASVAVGVPRADAQTMIYQSMRGSAAMLQSGLQPGDLRDQGTSPEGCTIGGIMVLEEAGVRGHLGRALREAVTTARLMETTTHVNDTRPTS